MKKNQNILFYILNVLYIYKYLYTYKLFHSHTSLSRRQLWGLFVEENENGEHGKLSQSDNIRCLWTLQFLNLV